jgi:hypothetical protein
LNPEDLMLNRRSLLAGTSLAAVPKVALAALPEPVIQTSPDTQAPLVPPNGRPYNPVVTLNGWSLPWRMNAGVKEFHLVAEPVVREMAPGLTARLWGYNGQSPGPTIEVVEGDRVRIYVTNRLPEATSMHWHGQRCPTAWTASPASRSPPSHRARPSSTSSCCAAGHLHVPPACRRDGADGDGHDGPVHRAPEGHPPARGGPRLRASC